MFYNISGVVGYHAMNLPLSKTNNPGSMQS